MSNNIKDITSFKPQAEDVFIFDTNVLIKIFYPVMGAANSTHYINLYKLIHGAKSKVYISGIQISEFINRCIRFQFKIYSDEHPEVEDFKKDYRETADYRENMDAILQIAREDILSKFERINDNFDSMDLDNLFMNSFSYDFNDAFIAELNRKYKTILVTDDKDYINFLNKLDIVTNNKALLMFRHQK